MNHCISRLDQFVVIMECWFVGCIATEVTDNLIAKIITVITGIKTLGTIELDGIKDSLGIIMAIGIGTALRNLGVALLITFYCCSFEL